MIGDRLRQSMTLAISAIALSVAVSAAALAENCFEGCPTGSPAGNTTIERSDYTLSNNPKTKFADWVAYKITKQTIGKTAKRVWRQDPDLSPDDTLAPGDYDGASTALKIDRGHQAPLASFTATDDWQMLNYLSNITPQSTALNQGPWEHLESAERALAKTMGVAAVYVMTGTLYEKKMPAMPKAKRDHVVPSSYWKVVLTDDHGEIKTAAFIMHQDAARSDDYCNFLVTVGEVEERTGLKFFSTLPTVQRRALAKEPGRLVDGVGCEFIETKSGGAVTSRR